MGLKFVEAKDLLPKDDSELSALGRALARDVKKDVYKIGRWRCSKYKGVKMKDLKIFCPYIHRRFLPVQYLTNAMKGVLLPTSPIAFRNIIRAWLGMEVSHILKLEEIQGADSEEAFARKYFLGSSIWDYLKDPVNIGLMLRYGNCLVRGRSSGWVYAVSEEWISKNIKRLYKAYLANGCYFTLTSLYAYGKLSFGIPLRAVNGDGTAVGVLFDTTTSFEDTKGILASILNDYEFRTSITKSCLSVLNVEEKPTLTYGDKKYLVDNPNSISDYKVFYGEYLKAKSTFKKGIELNLEILRLMDLHLEKKEFSGSISNLYVN